MKAPETRHPIAQRIAVCLVTIGGLVTAACISALPSASCSAIAVTYLHAIDLYFGIAMTGLLVLGEATIPHSGKKETSDLRDAIVYLATAAGLFVFVIGSAACESELRTAITACLTDKTAHPITMDPFNWIWHALKNVWPP